MIKFFAGLTACFVVLCAGYAIASRNSSGTYSIPNTFTSGSVISSSAVNANFSDIGTELTSSLDRAGRGAMTAQLQLASGTVTTPGLGFSSDTGSGLYRIGSNDIGFAINGTKKLELTSSLFTVTPAITLTGGVTGLLTATLAGSTSIKGLSGAAGSATDISVGRAASEARLGVSAGANNYAAGSAAGDIILGTLGTKLWIDTNSGSGTPSLAIAAANGGVIIGGGSTIASMYTGTCNASGLTPSTCTLTVPSGSTCLCTYVSGGGTVISCITSVVATTVTVKIADTLTGTIKVLCTS